MKAFDFSQWNDMARSEAERQSNAYREFIDLVQAIQTVHKLDLTIRSESCEDSVARGRFVSGLIGLYIDKRDASWPDFLATHMDVTEDNRGVYLKAHDKKSIIGVVEKFKEYAKGTGFTFTL
ncbi:hypothetical protein [Kosakonia phage 305]|uniref:Uncharacterized protein n=1 Tax=Kosakonia phage 305 TaxID=2863193 RepID=A0AAE7WGA1_9CAUD|nr:hypothetical protein PP421_gp172 [Kosakonia phage 305]QYN80428.1 hypothetical protein [Kosakonia phage 305]